MEKSELIIEKYKTTYGERFFFSDTESEIDHHKIVVMTAKQRQELQGLGDDKHEVLSIEESEGKELEIVGQHVNVYTRLTQNVNFLADQLNTDNTLRGLTSPINSRWVAIAVHHDFEQVAPIELGWVSVSNVVEKQEYQKAKPKILQGLCYLAEEMVGVPYLLGGKSVESGYDCSGFTQEIVYHTMGLMLPRISRWQALVGSEIDQKSLIPGDLIFFGKNNSPINHVGIVMEPTEKLPIIIHCSVRNKGVAVEDLNKETWLEDKVQIVGYRRI